MPRRASHAAHRSPAPTRTRTARGDAALRAETPEFCELLESLDDAVFEALGGCDKALVETRRLWPEVVAAVGPDLVDESREQYLRYAIELSRRFEFKEIRDPAVAVAALEIIEMLTRG